jgi:hypothetical protein
MFSILNISQQNQSNHSTQLSLKPESQPNQKYENPIIKFTDNFKKDNIIEAFENIIINTCDINSYQNILKFIKFNSKYIEDEFEDIVNKYNSNEKLPLNDHDDVYEIITTKIINIKKIIKIYNAFIDKQRYQEVIGNLFDICTISYRYQITADAVFSYATITCDIENQRIYEC